MSKPGIPPTMGGGSPQGMPAHPQQMASLEQGSAPPMSAGPSQDIPQGATDPAIMQSVLAKMGVGRDVPTPGADMPRNQMPAKRSDMDSRRMTRSEERAMPAQMAGTEPQEGDFEGEQGAIPNGDDQTIIAAVQKAMMGDKSAMMDVQETVQAMPPQMQSAAQRIIESFMQMSDNQPQDDVSDDEEANFAERYPANFDERHSGARQ